MPALGNIDELVEAIGYSAFETLVTARGGRRLYVPKSVDAAPNIAQWLGEEKADTLIQIFGGFSIDIPNRRPTTLPSRQPIIAALIEAGKSDDEIVDITGCTERSVRRYRSKMRDARPGSKPTAPA
jgi:DNA-binding NarL/FixJ family response regulator